MSASVLDVADGRRGAAAGGLRHERHTGQDTLVAVVGGAHACGIAVARVVATGEFGPVMIAPRAAEEPHTGTQPHEQSDTQPDSLRHTSLA